MVIKKPITLFPKFDFDLEVSEVALSFRNFEVENSNFRKEFHGWESFYERKIFPLLSCDSLGDKIWNA